jgi:hypothetical protein
VISSSVIGLSPWFAPHGSLEPPPPARSGGDFREHVDHGRGRWRRRRALPRHAGNERGELHRRDLEHAPKFADRGGVLVDPEIDPGVDLGAIDPKARGLAAALVAAGALCGLERPHQPFLERQARRGGEGAGHRIEHLGPGQHVALHGVIGGFALARPGCALAAGVRRTGA